MSGAERHRSSKGANNVMNLTKSLKSKAVLIALAGAAVIGAAPEARACGGAWYPVMIEDPDVDYRQQGVPLAEKALDEGRLLPAAGMVIRQIPHVKKLAPKSAKIVERAQRVLALAVVRYDGALPIQAEVPWYAQGTWRGKTAEQRRANLEWAVNVLRRVSELRKNDPASETELGEALAKVDDHRNEARALLEKLATKDLITSPEAYAALATLRARAGDASGEKLAVERCEKMARSTQVCRTPGHAAG
jgi:hypothetical protein